MGDMLKKFKINKEIRGKELVVTVSGEKEDIEKLNRKLDAMQVLAEDCCSSEGCGHSDEKGCCN
jgi:hypothetical protein